MEIPKRWVRIATMSGDGAERLRRGVNEAHAGPPVIFSHRYPVSTVHPSGEVLVLDSNGEPCCVGMEDGNECRSHPGVTCEPTAPPRPEEMFVQARL